MAATPAGPSSAFSAGRAGSVVSDMDDQMLRNHSVGRMWSGAASGPRLTAVMRMRMSSAEALAYSTNTSK